MSGEQGSGITDEPCENCGARLDVCASTMCDCCSGCTHAGRAVLVRLWRRARLLGRPL